MERAPGAGVSRVKCVVLGDGLMTREIFGEAFPYVFQSGRAEGVLEKKTRVPNARHRLRAPATVATPAPAHLSAFEFRVEERRAWYV